jgi:hypothetical protein
MLPSFYASARNERSWNVTRAALYGAAIGALAAVFKVFGPLHHVGSLAAHVLEIAAAAAAFAFLCASAALLRNFIARRLIWPQMR